MLMDAAVSYSSVPVRRAMPSQTLLTTKAPSGTVTIAGCGLWPSNSSVLSTTLVIGSMDRSSRFVAGMRGRPWCDGMRVAPKFGRARGGTEGQPRIAGAGIGSLALDSMRQTDALGQSFLHGSSAILSSYVPVGRGATRHVI